MAPSENANARAQEASKTKGPPSWAGSKYESYNNWAAAKKGRFGELILKHALAEIGMHVTKSDNNTCDFYFNGLKMESRVSSMNSKGKFVIRNIGEKPDATEFFLILVCPNEVRMYMMPQSSLYNAARDRGRGRRVKTLTLSEEQLDAYFGMFKIETIGEPDINE